MALAAPDISAAESITKELLTHSVSSVWSYHSAGGPSSDQDIIAQHTHNNRLPFISVSEEDDSPLCIRRPRPHLSSMWKVFLNH